MDAQGDAPILAPDLRIDFGSHRMALRQAAGRALDLILPDRSAGLAGSNRPSYALSMEATEEIKSRLDVADVVGEYVALKPAGSGAFKAVCPFHQEKTPSFYVSRPRQSWHCFGCDQGGDLISFVMKMEGMEFREALEHLAQKAGVALPRFDQEKAGARKRLQDVHAHAVKYYQAVLHVHPAAEGARAYLKRRGVDDLTADLFQLGYALPEWSGLHDALLKQGVTAEEMLKAGLAVRRENGSGVYDRFRGRIMFPIQDVHGNSIGFTARILEDGADVTGGLPAKYINTPETELYRKSAVLYGLDKAKGDIRQKDLAIIVEGNMDVIGSHQFGVLHVVAASGTALTAEQLALLKRFTTNLAIAFDQDAAGHAATLRGLDLARAQDFSIRIITLPPGAGKDPDEAVRKNPEMWKGAISDAVGIMEWVYRTAFRERSMPGPEEKKQIAARVLPEIRRIADPIERDHWLQKLSRDLGVSDLALREALARKPDRSSLRTDDPRAVQTQVKTERPAASRVPETALDRRVFALLLSRSHFLAEARVRYGFVPSLFHDPTYQALYVLLEARYDTSQVLSATAGSVPAQAIRPPEGLSPDEAKEFDALAFLAESAYEGFGTKELEQELVKGIAALRAARDTRDRRKIEQEMRDAERAGDQTRIAELERAFAEVINRPPQG